MNDILQITRLRLAEGLRVADYDVIRLCDEIENLRARIAEMKKAVIQCRSLTELLKPQADRIAELEAALQKKGCARDQTTTHYCAEVMSRDARIAELEAALKDAAASVKEWGAYASAYLQEKWDLPGEVARYIAIAEGKKDE